MDIFINELSLNGQFDSIDSFINIGLLPLLKIYKYIDNINKTGNKSIILFKKHTLIQTKITADKSFYDLLNGDVSHHYDELRKLKTHLVNLTDNPYWNMEPKQCGGSAYFYNGNNVSGSSLAEACERDKIVISFCHHDFLSELLLVYRDAVELCLDNIREYRHLLELVYKREVIPFDLYCFLRFSSSDSKLDFSQVDPKNGFALIKVEDEQLFFKDFEKIDKLSWEQIFNDIGLDYKLFNAKDLFFDTDKKIYKFRVSRKYRCFGYRQLDKFFVLRFDLQHKLSDEG